MTGPTTQTVERDSAARPSPQELAGVAEFVRGTREHVFLRECDRAVILRPNKIYRVNDTAWTMLTGLYASEGADPVAVARTVASEHDVAPDRVLADVIGLVRTLSGLLRDDISGCGHIRRVGFGDSPLEWPILAEIALTYGCQARCRFCYASAPDRARSVEEMRPDEVEAVIDRIALEAHCPSLSFSGGEPTLDPALARYIARAKSRGLRVNLITNGIKCADRTFCESLSEAGLDSAQVSLEAGSGTLHDEIVGRPGAFDATVSGVRELRRAGIHTHTNTTICGVNKGRLAELVEFVARELESQYFSMNIVIRTGASLSDPEMDIAYAELRDVVPPVFELAERLGVKPVWYSPTPLCVFNPMEHGVSSSTCACCESLLSVNPSGDVLPCSSFEHGVGNLARQPFETVWRSPRARYWRSKAAAPPGCSACELYRICYGACPLYWDERGSFDEIDGARPGYGRSAIGRERRRPWADTAWALRRRVSGRVFGVGIGPSRRARS